MYAFELFNERGEPCGVWCCGKCRKLRLDSGDVWPPTNTKEAAEACCKPRICACGEPATEYSSQCDKCRTEQWRRESAEKLRKRIETATDVTATHDGPVFIEDYCGGDWGEGYFSDAGVAADYLADNEDWQQEETWAFACHAEVRGINLDDALERICDDGYEDMGSDLVIPQSLHDAVDAWNKENEARLTIYSPDYRRKILIRTTTVPQE